MSIPKIITMYLPQFHRVKENDLWWGEGYTEWTAVKSAEPLYSGHVQPKEPLNDNYYDLLEKETMQWQADLMHKYGIFGQCFYHYYFKNGKKILEKPAENLLKWEKIDMPFCFSWANESWTRTCSKLSDDRNSWNDLIEPQKQNDDEDGVLLLQDYGGRKEWEDHFYYLLPFFKDKRYIRIDDKPVFIIYMANSIYCLNEMVECWQKLAISEGLKGVYFISTNRKNQNCDGELISEPGFSIRRMLKSDYSGASYGISMKADYETVYKRCLSSGVTLGENVFRGIISGYDDTPRRGKGGMVLDGCTPEMFEDYLRESLAASKNANSDYLFINAWNEWGEGMYLEPDKKYGYAFLEAVKKAIETIDDAKGDCEPVDNASNDQLEIYIKKLEQYDAYWRLFDKWMVLKENDLSLDVFFEENNYSSIAVYGLGMLGRHLLADISIERVAFGIDGKADTIRMDFPIYSPVDAFPKADIIVVTPTYDYDSIVRLLKQNNDCKVVSLGYVIDHVYNSKLIK